MRLHGSQPTGGLYRMPASSGQQPAGPSRSLDRGIDGASPSGQRIPSKAAVQVCAPPPIEAIVTAIDAPATKSATNGSISEVQRVCPSPTRCALVTSPMSLTGGTAPRATGAVTLDGLAATPHHVHHADPRTEQSPSLSTRAPPPLRASSRNDPALAGVPRRARVTRSGRPAHQYSKAPDGCRAPNSWRSSSAKEPTTLTSACTPRSADTRSPCARSHRPPQPADFPRELLDPLHLAVGHVAPLDEHEGHGL